MSTHLSVMFIRIHGANQHNLKNIDLTIPLYKITGICGVSGSGKSTLAFHVLHAEGQRRYIETFSPYTRQFLERLDPPHVDSIENIPPSIALEGGTTVQNARSTVGTITEINDFLKYLYAFRAEPYCPFCKRPIHIASPESVVRYLRENRRDDKFYITALWSETSCCEGDVKQTLVRQGYIRIIVDGKPVRLDNEDHKATLEPPLWIVQDRVIWEFSQESRILESLRQAFVLGKGRVGIVYPDGYKEEFTSLRVCGLCGLDIPDGSAEIFSFNSPVGACPECRGLGRIIGVNINAVIPDTRKSIRDGAVTIWTPDKYEYQELIDFCLQEGIPIDVPFQELKEEDQRKIIDGTKDYYGIRGFFAWLETKTYKLHVRVFLSRYRAYNQCHRCLGTRYGDDARFYRLIGVPIYELQSWSIESGKQFFENHRDILADRPSTVVLVNEILKRLQALHSFRLGYLTLDRPSRTLSGGEVQRVHFVKVLGSALSNVLYILDEPSLGLHPHDQETLMDALRWFVDKRNTVVIVDHDPQLLRKCDHLVELGPGGGRDGGRIISEGTPYDIMTAPDSLTGRYLQRPLLQNTLRNKFEVTPYGYITVRGAKSYNLKNITVRFPLGVFVGVSGVSGAGKTTLVENTLYSRWRRMCGLHQNGDIGECDVIEGIENISEMFLIDRRPVGRNPRANLLTYTGAMTWIRKLLASTEDASIKGIPAAFFSFNQPGGRCEVCQGEGFERHEMQFLADVYSPCPACKGRRFKDDVLRITYKGWSIADFLESTAADVIRDFQDSDKFEKNLRHSLTPLSLLNIDHLSLGQPLATFSSGESQRLKLVPLLQKSLHKKKRMFLILDEPSRGLHPADLENLVNVFLSLTRVGHTVLVVEHNLSILVSCDWIIDLGPEGGDKGGEVVFEGPPHKLVQCEKSLTGKHIKRRLDWSDSHRLVQKKGEASSTSHAVELSGVRHHNLRIDHLEIPLGQFVALTGLSGSGKSTLAFDVIHSEGQRRYLECLSTYIRQYFAIFEKPEVDAITGLPPTVTVEQRLARAGRKSTVGTLTEIYHFLRLLFAKAGRQRCISCGREVKACSVDEIAGIAQGFHRQGALFFVPVVYRRKGVYRDLIKRLRRLGFKDARIDGKWVRLENVDALSRYDDHTIEVALPIVPGNGNFVDSIVRGLRMGEGFITVRLPETGQEEILSTGLMCHYCNIGYLPMDPRLFSFNSPYGVCQVCEGTGIVQEIREDMLLGDGAIPLGNVLEAWVNAPFIPMSIRKRWKDIWYGELAIQGFNRLCEIPQEKKKLVLHGNSHVSGLVTVLERLLREGELPDSIARNLCESECPACHGFRINDQARMVEIGGYAIPDIVSLTTEDFIRVWLELFESHRHELIFSAVHPEVLKRTRFLLDVGLDYLTLARSGDTLSGGEFQRMRLTAHLGSNLTGVLYVLDEPTIGLHPVDTEKLLRSLKHIRDMGNTVLVVEHDSETLRAADVLIELGPGGGIHGGKITGVGTFDGLLRKKGTITHEAFGEPITQGNEVKKVPGHNGWLEVYSIYYRNLENVHLRIPLKTLTSITGVSGSGKSTLVYDVLYPIIMEVISGAPWYMSAGVRYSRISGFEAINTVHSVDHQPIGRTSRSIPATYLGIWDYIRKIFASLPESRARGFTPSHFSFNIRGGRCDFCAGQGYITERMSFLPDVERMCPVCEGKRFAHDILEIYYRYKNISNVLNMTFEEAEDFFSAYPRIARAISVVNDLGMGYLRLGQPSPTLSGGEAQRIKLARGLKKNSRPALFLLDEPTTGLHRLDVWKLVSVLRRLVCQGHTIVVIEHNMDFIRLSDYIIDLGPESGEQGGRIIAEGTPEDMQQFTTVSCTAAALFKDNRM